MILAEYLCSRSNQKDIGSNSTQGDPTRYMHVIANDSDIDKNRDSSDSEYEDEEVEFYLTDAKRRKVTATANDNDLKLAFFKGGFHGWNTVEKARVREVLQGFHTYTQHFKNSLYQNNQNNVLTVYLDKWKPSRL